MSEASRRALHTRLQEVLGTEDADLLMEYLPPVGWSQLATRQNVDVLGTELRGEIAILGTELRGEMATLAGELRAEMATQTRTIMLGLLMAALATIGTIAAMIGTVAR